MSVITRNQNRRVLLVPTSVPLFATQTITSIARAGTTATATKTSHGFATGDWIIIQGSDRPQYNGIFKVANALTNTFDYTMESDPGASSAGVITAQRGIIASVWGDGSTVDGNVTVGSLPSAIAGDLTVLVTTTTAPTSPCRISVYRSETGASGTWRSWQIVDTTKVANDQQSYVIEVPRGKFVMVFLWNVAGTVVFADVIAYEDTSYTNT